MKLADKIEHISESDVLNAGREKINKFAIDPAMRAEQNSVNAQNVANQSQQISTDAKDIAKNTDSRLDNIVAGEMQDAEVIDARKPFGSETYETLSKRLDGQIGKNSEFRNFENDVSFMQRVYNETVERELNPKWFGAKGDGVTDDTDAFKKLFDFAKNRQIKNIRIVSEGKYFLSSRGVDDDGRHYAVKIDDLENVNIDFNFSEFVVDRQSDAPSFFSFYSCKKVDIFNYKAVSDDKAIVATIPLYCNAGIYFKNCKRCKVKESSFYNTKYGVCSMHSSEIIVENTIYDNNLTKFDYKFRGASAIIFYATAKSIARGNIIFGALHDGDLSIFGGGTDDCLVESNTLYGYSSNEFEEDIIYSQGITIDQGPRNTQVINNFVKRYFYGIDCKSNAFNTVIRGNHISDCKVGIADREGEAAAFAYHTLNTVIQDNVVLFGASSKKSSYLHHGVYGAVGIAISNRYSAFLTGNSVEVTTNDDISDQTVVCYALSQSDSPTEYLNTIIVEGNRAILQTGHDAKVSRAGINSACVHASKAKCLKVSNNTFKLAYEGTDAYKHTILAIEDGNGTIELTNNSIFGNNLKTETIKRINSATIDKFISYGNMTSNIIGTNFEYFVPDNPTKTYFSYNNPSAKVEFAVNGITGINDQWIELTKIYTQYTSNIVGVTVNGVNNESNLKYVDVSLLVNFENPTTVSTQAIRDNKLRYDLRVVNISSGVFSLQVRAQSDISNARFIVSINGLGINVWV